MGKRAVWLISKEEVEARYLAGEGGPSLAKASGVSYFTLYETLRSRGVVLRTNAQAHLIPKDEEGMVRDYLAGLTLEEVGAKHGWSGAVVLDLLVRRGIPRRPGGAKGPRNNLWRGGKTRHSKGGYDRDHNDELIHVQVTERLLGRELKHWEVGHHIDGVKTNNRDDNLVGMPEKEHLRFHTFTRLRDMPTNRESLTLCCRQEGPFYFRFTVKDADVARPRVPNPHGFSLGPRRPPRKCRVRDCGRKHYAKGLCSLHATRRRKTGRLHLVPRKIKKCSAIRGCGKRIYKENKCFKHWYRATKGLPLNWEKKIRLCSVEGCGLKHSSLGFCVMHRQRFKNGIPLEGDARPSCWSVTTEQIVEAFSRIKNQSVVALELGISRVKVARHLKKAGVSETRGWTHSVKLGKPIPPGMIVT